MPTEVRECLQPQVAPPAWRRNFGLLLSEVAFFFTGLAFIDPATILPTFLSEFIHSPFWIGALIAFRGVALVMPQLWMPQLLAHRAYAKPVLLTVGGIGRLCMILFALWLWFFGREAPGLILPFFLVAAGMFMLGDGAAWVPWTAMVERSLPPSIHARFFGAMVSLSALMALPAGWVVEKVLTRWQFPANYGLLFLLCGLCILLSWLCLYGVQEQPRTDIYEHPLPLKHYLQELRRTFQEDRHFAQLLLALALLSTYSLSANFYVLDALQLWQAKAWVGWYLMAQQVGGVVSGLLWDFLRRYLSTRDVLQITAYTICLIAPTALLCRSIAPAAYLIPFFLQGMILWGSWGVGAAYLLEQYPADAKQIMRIGAFNTLFAASAGTPLLGGLIGQGLSYPWLFLITSLLTLSGAWKLRSLNGPEANEAGRSGVS